MLPSPMNPPTKLLNRAQVKRFALDCAATRAHRFTRVSASFLLGCETSLKEYIRRQVKSHPSKGKTLR